jgi:hypothetical protein
MIRLEHGEISGPADFGEIYILLHNTTERLFPYCRDDGSVSRKYLNTVSSAKHETTPTHQYHLELPSRAAALVAVRRAERLKDGARRCALLKHPALRAIVYRHGALFAQRQQLHQRRPIERA